MRKVTEMSRFCQILSVGFWLALYISC